MSGATILVRSSSVISLPASSVARASRSGAGVTATSDDAIGGLTVEEVTVAHFAARQPASPRNLAHDVYLYCDTRDANLGRITSTVPAGDENDSRVTVTTTLGRFVLHSDGKIERGKLLKESLHGCYTSRRASE